MSKAQSASPVIDGLAHVTKHGPWVDGKLDASREKLLSEMDGSGFSHAVLTALPGFIDNDTVIETCRARPDRFFGFVSAPCAATAEVRAELRRAKDAGMVGAKLHPRLGRYRLDDPRTDEMVKVSVELDLPVMLCGIPGDRGHAGAPPPHEAIAKWADLYPSHTFILVHAGSHRVLDAWHVARVRENVFLDLSHSLHYYRGSSVETDLGFVARRLDQRVLFGTDFPESSLAAGLDNLNRLLKPWPEANRAAILGGTWMSILKKHGAWRNPPSSGDVK